MVPNGQPSVPWIIQGHTKILELSRAIREYQELSYKSLLDMLDAGPNYAHSGPMCRVKCARHIIFCARIVFSMVILVSIEPPSTRFWKTSLSWILLMTIAIDLIH